MNSSGSRIIGTLAAMFLLIGLCASAPAAAQEWLYTVRPGDNLWNLSAKYLTRVGYYRRLQELNGIADPHNIPPGSRLRIPIAWMKHQPTTARVVKIVGAVQRLPADGDDAIEAVADMELHAGDGLRTGADASATIEFADGSRLLLQADTTVEMDTLSVYGDSGMVDTRVRLPAGRVDTQVTPARGPATRYEIITPAAVAAVRGTDFRVGAAADAPLTRSEVLAGRVGVQAGGVTRAVPGGFGTLAQEGRAPAPPRRLLPAPNIASLPARVERVPVALAWPEVAGAARYRVQMFPRAQLDTLLADRLSHAASARFDELPDGDYTMRMRAIDADGLEGLNADHAFTLDARPFPPLAMEPVEGRTVRDTQPEFRWSAPEGISRYHFQLAADAEFHALELDAGGHGETTIRPPAPLAFGRHYWRIASVDANGERGPFSDVQQFELKPVPASPGLEAAQVDERGMSFRWQTTLDNARYQFQLARDAEFQSILVDRTVAEPGLTLPRPSAGTYFVRVRTLDADGYAGPYGPVQRLRIEPDSFWPLLIPLVPLLL